MASASNMRMSRDDYKKHKELEELRKTGAAPPAVDDDGKMINPHIPQYISAAPWYLNANKPGLKHQYTKHFRTGDDVKIADVNTFYQKGKRKAGAALKFQKGACENCGATTHKTKECCERPRHKTAKLTGQNIAADDVVEDLHFDYEGKRDRWRGYDPSTYQRVIETYEKTEAERKAAKKRELDAELANLKHDKAEKKRLRREERRKEKEAKRAAKKEAKAKAKAERDAKRAAEDIGEGSAAAGETGTGDGAGKPKAAAAAASSDSDSDSDAASDSDSDSDSDDETEAAEAKAEGLEDKGQLIQGIDTKRGKTSVRNLRIREDTAKYLRNLNINSAHYDPKTRSMRDNPYPSKDPKELLYAGDNFVRHSGDAKSITDAQRFVWDANDRGVEEINILSNPSQAEAMFKQFQEKKEKLKDQRKNAVLSKYGGAQHLSGTGSGSGSGAGADSEDAIAAERELLLMQSDHYVEYSEDGRVIKGQEKAIPKTKYVEDALENNHSLIWGSYFDLTTGKWGYGCCHQTTRHAYCTGEAGKLAKAQVTADLDRKKDMAFKPVVASASSASSASSSAAASGSSASGAGATTSSGSGGDKKLGVAVGEGLVRSVHSDAGGDAAYSEKLRAAIRAEKARQKQVDADDSDARDLRDARDADGGRSGKGGKSHKPKYTAHHSAPAPTSEEMEAHKMLTIRPDDPMAKFLKG